MKIKTNYYLTIVIFLILNIFLIVKNVTLKKKFDDIKKEYFHVLEEQKALFLNEIDLLSQDLYISEHLVNEIIEEKSTPVLIYTYAGDECNRCVIEDIDLLKSLITPFNSQNLIVLPVFNQSRDVDISIDADLKGINYKRIDDEGYIKFPQREDGNRVRYFAVLTPEHKTILPFFPSTKDTVKTRIYLEYVFNYILTPHDEN